MAFWFKCYINSFDVLIYKLKICMQRRACLSSHEVWLCSVFMAPLQLDWLSLHSRSHFWSSSECQQWMLQSIPRRYLGRTQVTWTINLSQISNNNYSFSLSTSIVGLHICRWSIFTSLHLYIYIYVFSYIYFSLEVSCFLPQAGILEKTKLHKKPHEVVMTPGLLLLIAFLFKQAWDEQHYYM